MDIIHAQVDRYRKDGYPENNGLARTTVVFRRHNESDVIKKELRTLLNEFIELVEYEFCCAIRDFFYKQSWRKYLEELWVYL